MTKQALEHLLKEINLTALPFDIGNEQIYRNLLNKIGDANIVCLGEATHGTQEFYATRIEISKRLILEKNFNVIAIEGDWTSTYHIQRYIKNATQEDINQTLKAFYRFPTWMWSNETMPPLLHWLREYNATQHKGNQINFYGLDLYCLHEAMNAVIDYLDNVDSKAAQEARQRYACFDHTAVDPQTYGYQVDSGIKKSCIQEVQEQLLALQRMQLDKLKAQDEQGEALFYAEQNARVVKNAEAYYRGLFEARDITWNLRDKHMAESLRAIRYHVEQQTQRPAKVIIWAHNSHVGDARATEMSERNELNLGQLVREQYPNQTFLLGFSTYSGTVTAAHNWGEPPTTMQIKPGMPSSYEDLFHAAEHKNFLLDLHAKNLQTLLHPSRLQRAIGVIYRPQNERLSHYFFTQLTHQFDALIHLDETSALKPLNISVPTII